MSKYTLAAVKSAAAKFGAIVQDDSAGKYRTYNVVAPDGQRWSGDGIHCLLIEFRPGESKGWAEECYKDALDRMGYGLEPCDGEDCAFCDGLI